MTLDVRTLYIALGVSCFLVSGSFLFFQARQFRTDGVREWSAGYALQGAYWVLLGLREIIPDFLSILVANLFLTANYCLLYAAVQSFRRHRYRRGIIFLPVFITLAFFLIFWAVTENFYVRTIYITLASGLQLAAVAFILFRDVPFKIRRSQWLTGCFFALGALLWFARFLQAFSNSRQQLQLMGPSIVLTAILLLGFGVVVLTSIGFLLMIRERAGEALRDSEQRWATTLASIGDAVIATDITGNITFMNAVAEDLTGWRISEALQKPARTVFAVINEQTRREVEDPVMKVLAKGTIVGLANHTVLIRKDGGEVPIDDSAAPIRNWQGNIIGVVLVFRDVTARKHAEETLRLSEEKFAVAFAGNPAAIALTSLEDGIFLEVNDTWVAMNGYSREEVIGLSARKLPIWPTIEAASRFIRELQEKGSLHGWEQEFLKKSGEVFAAELSAQILTLRGKKMILSTLIDVTKRRQAERHLTEQAAQLQERTAQLEEINKELESFSYSVSHDLRAPLRAIEGYSRMILKKHGDKFDEDVQIRFNVIRENTQKMGQLIDDLLNLSRLGKQQMKEVKLDMADLAKDIWKELREINPERVMTLEIKDMPRAHGDMTLIRQVYLNLLGNAIKFTKQCPAAQIVAGGHAEGKENVYYVRDNGAGFDMAYYDKLFGVFQRLHSTDDFEGTGVGLAIVQRIIHRHGGRVWAEGKVGKGATFYFSLPQK